MECDVTCGYSPPVLEQEEELPYICETVSSSPGTPVSWLAVPRDILSL